jgi:DNA-binding CsgD family transcriptional regulator
VDASRSAPFVGRDTELRELDTALVRASTGTGGLVVVSGEAGVGKTRLWREAIGRWSGSAPHLLVGRSFPEDKAQMAPIADTFRAAKRMPAALLWQLAGERSEVMSQMLPDLGHSGLAPPTSQDALLFETVLDAVEESAQGDWVIWVLEDLHWADRTSIDFVAYAARRLANMRLVLLVTYRDEELPRRHPWRARLPLLQHQAGVAVIALQRLTPSATEQLVRALVGAGPSSELVAELASRSAGTPLLAEELAAAGIGAAVGHQQVPQIVRATLSHRMRGLNPAARDLMDLAAVAGRDPDIQLLLGLRPGSIDANLERLCDVGLMTLESDVETRVRFRHPLLQEAAYRQVPPLRRRQLHLGIAEWLDRRNPDIEAEMVAHHLDRAGEPELGLRKLIEAAARFAASGNVGRAGSLAMSALALIDNQNQLATRRAEVARLAVDNLFRAGRWTEVVPLARATWAEVQLSQPSERAGIANILALALFFAGDVRKAKLFVEEQIDQLTEVDSGSAAALLSSAAFIFAFSGDAQRAGRYATRSVDLAQDAASAEIEHRVRNISIFVRWRIDRRRREAAAAHLENAQRARAAGLVVGEANSLWNHALMTTQLEDLIHVETTAARAGTWYASLSRLLQGFIHLLEGRPQEAEQLFGSVRSQIILGIPMMATIMETTEAHLLLHRGQLDATERHLARAGAEMRMSHARQWLGPLAGCLGWLAWEQGRLEDAVRHLRVCAREANSLGYHATELGPIMVALEVDSLVRLGRKIAARRAIDRALAPYSEPDRFLAPSAAAGRFLLDPSPSSAEVAESAAASAPWPWLEALVLCWRGEHLKDAEAAGRAFTRFEELEAARGVERAAAVLRNLGVPSRKRGGRGGRYELSDREREVAELVAQGLTNTAIAGRLFLSRPTVSSHVANILAKLEFSSRAQIAAWVEQQRQARWARDHPQDRSNE